LIPHTITEMLWGQGVGLRHGRRMMGREAARHAGSAWGESQRLTKPLRYFAESQSLAKNADNNKMEIKSYFPFISLYRINNSYGEIWHFKRRKSNFIIFHDLYAAFKISITFYNL